MWSVIRMDELITKLNTTSYPFAHYGWSKAPQGDYGVVSETGGNDLTSNDTHIERGTEGTVDLFTRDDSSAPRIAVETVLNEYGCAWQLNSVQFEEDTGYIHYEWLVGIYG